MFKVSRVGRVHATHCLKENFAVQVDSLKKELAQQAVLIAQDLGRLESEKRAVETKIANLHAFHANQKQNLGQVGLTDIHYSDELKHF
jgi:hypothetical protein